MKIPKNIPNIADLKMCGSLHEFEDHYTSYQLKRRSGSEDNRVKEADLIFQKGKGIGYTPMYGRKGSSPMDSLQERVNMLSPDYWMFTSEVWSKEFDINDPNKPKYFGDVAKHTDKTEMLMIIVCARGFKPKLKYYRFMRNQEQTVLTFNEINIPTSGFKSSKISTNEIECVYCGKQIAIAMVTDHVRVDHPEKLEEIFKDIKQYAKKYHPELPEMDEEELRQMFESAFGIDQR